MAESLTTPFVMEPESYGVYQAEFDEEADGS
jgi:hypothetical protein